MSRYIFCVVTSTENNQNILNNIMNELDTAGDYIVVIITYLVKMLQRVFYKQTETSFFKSIKSYFPVALNSDSLHCDKLDKYG